jgi:tetratricopeptide (TPR) repeat protein
MAEEKNNLKMVAYYRIGKNKLDQLGDNAVALRELAIQAAILGKTEEAIELWVKFIALKPDVPEAFVHLGTAYFKLKNYQAALQTAKKAMALNPDMPEGVYNYALCELIIGDIDNTIMCLKNLLFKSSGFLPARFVLAAAQICSGNRDAGLQIFKELSRTAIGQNLKATCMDLAQRLAEVNRSHWAKSLLESTGTHHAGGFWGFH